MAPHVPVEATYGFEYFMRGENLDGSELTKSLSIRIIHPDGRVLGVESIGLRVESRKDLDIEYL
jgi:hypothetical protein